MIRPFDDRQMRDFIINGYAVIKTELPTGFHEDICQRTQEMLEEDGQPGNNLIARIPELKAVLDDPGVAGALTAILGSNYFVYPHRFLHVNQPESTGQPLHIDSMTRRRHRTRWAMAMYYPQDTTEDMGPTGILPRSQYYSNRDRKDPPWGDSSGGVLMPVQAGTVVLVHYDIWHRGTANWSKKKRFMMKFLFVRMQEPKSPSWDNNEIDWQNSSDNDDAIWASQWDWHLGRSGANVTDNILNVDDHLEHMREAGTGASLNSTYTMATGGDFAIPYLIPMLRDDSETVRRNASYALAAIGKPGVEPLIELLGDQKWTTRSITAETLGDIGLPAGTAISSLIHALEDSSGFVRSKVAEALGIISQDQPTAVLPLTKALGDEEVDVRRDAALALCRIGIHSNQAVPSLAKALEDEDRYVRGDAVHALYSIGSPMAQELLIDYLLTSRWDSLTKGRSYY